MTTRTILTVLVLALVVLFAATASGTQEKAAVGVEVHRTGFPIVDEKITLKGFGRLDPQHQAWDTMTLWKKYEPMTNIHIEWETPGQDNVNERKNLVLASGDLPDFFIKTVLNEADLIRYGTDGALIPLEDLIAEWGPNLKKLLEEHPDWRQAITAPDGHIYGLPRLTPFAPQNVWRYPLTNMVWLERLGLKVPDDYKQFYAMMQAFRDKDANANGDPNDEIAYSAHNPEFALRGVMGMFGIVDEVDFNGNYPMRIEGKRVHIELGDPEFREALQYYSRMFQEKLLDQEIFVHTNKDYFGKLAAGRIGFTPLYQPRNAAKYANEYDAIVPPKGPRGDRYWNFLNTVVADVNSFEITSSNHYPEATMRWVDYFYSDEGALLMRMVDKKLYDEMPDGSLQYKKEVLEAEQGMTRFLGQHTIWGGSGEPGYFVGRVVAPAMAGTPMLTYIERVEAYLPKTRVRAPLFSSSDQERINEIRGDLDTYVTEMRAKFAAGDVSFDKWDEYVSTMEKMGLRELEDIISKAMFEK